MADKSKVRNDVRTTISLAQVVWEMAETMMREKGFNDNFSAYVADLIRRDLERSKSVEALGRLALNERPKPRSPAEVQETR